MELTNKDIIAHIESIDIQLKTNAKIKFEYNTNWANLNFEDSPAIYALFDKGTLVYIGQTASLLKRMKDLRKTYNHSFRKQLGRKLFETVENKKGVFVDKDEHGLTLYFEKNIEITFTCIYFGRLEAESYLIHKNKGENSDLLFNKIGKRDLKTIEKMKADN
ncbi:hypothetical protein [Aquimarina sp. RZ0]|uniref:hypothetical protein n=1 Tax=Aquimarina sp. RZ0 TaxID=2607730 RepID=UPI0011F20DED|nr:hypothetical protein [Aquimarina sp. RZ0]KAA1245839.1 hypothetical protein F0000_10615 [Aquimarina sp. RZ0]